MLSLLTSPFRILIGGMFLGVAALVFGVVCLPVLPSRRRRIALGCRFGHAVGRVIMFLAGASLPPGVQARVAATYPAIYISNHTSFLDLFFGAWAAPVPTISAAKREIVWVPFFGQVYALSGHVRFNRASKQQAASALRDLTNVMQRYHTAVWLWPEGTRSADGRLRPFKRGFAHLALATRLPIVPVVVTNAHRCCPKGTIITSPARIGVQVLDPIPTVDWTVQNIDHHVADVHARFIAALPDDQKPAPR
jgi:lysophosphatidate acyltransferase